MNIQEQLNSLIRGNPLSVDTYLREVCKNEHISDTKASMHIYMLKLDGNNRPRTCDFCDTCLLKKSVCSQISNLIRDNSENDENIVDWAYLISCASILAHSTDGTVLDIAYRICQATVCEAGLQREYKSAAAAIFDLSANSSAIALSESRHLIDSNFRSRIPWGIMEQNHVSLSLHKNGYNGCLTNTQKCLLTWLS